MSKKKYETFSKEFWLEVIRLAEASDKPVTEVARGSGLRVNRTCKWWKQLKDMQDTAFTGQADGNG